MQKLLIATGFALWIFSSVSVGSRAPAYSVPCNQYDTIEKYENGSIRSCRLSKDFKIQGVQCTQDGFIQLYENGKLEECIPSNKTSWKRANKPGGEQVLCMYSASIRLYETGTLQLCGLEHDIKIGDVTCQASGQIILNEDGSLYSCLKRRRIPELWKY
jgi:hypothetical protein